jgi:hypothetical protein
VSVKNSVTFILLIFVFALRAHAVEVVPDFYALGLPEKNVTITHEFLNEEQGLLYSDLFTAMYPWKDRDTSLVHQLATKLFDELEIKYQVLNGRPPHNYRITDMPEGLFDTPYFREVVKRKGLVTVVFDQEPLLVQTSATDGGILIDSDRFLMSLINVLEVIPHEVSHFVHWQELKRNQFKPYHSRIWIANPLLDVDWHGFMIDEME